MILPGDIELALREDGPRDGAPLVLLHALGLDGTMFDPVLPLLPAGLRVIRPDLRGHGASPAPEGDYFMGDLVGDVARAMDRLGARNAVVLGVSLGGIIAQGLAAERLTLVRGLVLSNTAVKIGTAQAWRDRMEAVRSRGIAAVAEPTMARWFAPALRDGDAAQAVRARLTACPVAGYAGCCAAIADTDLYESTAALRLPTLAIAGDADGSTPPDMVREMAGLIPGAQVQLIRGAGHLPCIDHPQEFAAHVGDFLAGIGHV